MGTTVAQFSHDDIDPSSISVPSFGHDDIDPSSINVHSAPVKSWLDMQLPLGTSPRGIIQGGLNALPVAGGIAGGIAGSPADLVTGPTGTIVGAGMGYAGGTALKKAGEQFLLGQDHSAGNVLKDTALAVPDGMAQEMGGKFIGDGVSAAANTSVGKAALGKAGSLAARAGEALTGVPKQEIKTFAANAPQIEQLSANNDHNTQDIADAIRDHINQTIKTFKKSQNDKISGALAGLSTNRGVNITPLIDKLEEAKSGLDPSLHPEAIDDIQNLIDRVKGTTDLKKNVFTHYEAPNEKIAVTTPGYTASGSASKAIPEQPATQLMDEVPNALSQRLKGKVSNIESTPVIRPALKTDGTPHFLSPEQDRVLEFPIQGRPQYFTSAGKLHQINQFLQDQASGAYGTTPTGFQIGTRAANGAKNAAGVGREMLSGISPDIAAANKNLATLHDIEDVMNRNMLTEGKTASPLLAAGADTNQANAKVLKQLGSATGQDILGEAQKLSAARTFGQPQFLPQGSNGKVVGHLGVGSGIGGVLGGAVGGVPGAVIGGAIGGAATSPQALKVAIKAGRAAASPTGQAVAALGTRLGVGGGLRSDSVETPNVPTPSSVPDSSPTLNPLTNGVPTKGPDKWAQDGANKLIQHADNPDDKAAIQKLKGANNDSGTKNLLIQASDLKPGSKAMSNVMAKIKAKIASDD